MPFAENKKETLSSDSVSFFVLQSMIEAYIGSEKGKGRGKVPPAVPMMVPYDRAAAVAYAHQWAYGRNPAYFNYDEIGGDCTNFASQCLYEGTGIMNFTPTFGWYYIDPNRKAPAWSGVQYFYNFMTRGKISPGPLAVETDLNGILPGDFVQLRFRPDEFGHTPIVVEIGFPPTLENTLVAAHTDDADWRPLSSYIFQEIRYLHILGAWPPQL